MGASLPLPERVPLPSDADLVFFEGKGIKFMLETTTRCAGVSVCPIELPAGWLLVDRSAREDLPNWVIIDGDDRIWASINGAWKGAYDNELSIDARDGTDRFVKPVADPIPAEHTPDALVATGLAIGLDPAALAHARSKYDTSNQ